jgi:hypothetical protein
MHSHASQFLLWSIVTVLVSAGSASAEQKTSWLTNPFSVSSGMENIPTSGGGLAMEGVVLVTPSRISFTRASSRTHWGVGYQPEFEFRAGTGFLSSFNQSADASYGHLFSRRTKLDLGHSFVESSDPARIFTENIFVMPRDGFRENATAVTLSHELAARTTTNFRFDNTITRMNTGDAGAALLNQTGVAGTVGISQHLSPRHKITVSYSLLKFRPYRLDSTLDTGLFAANVPMVKAGIALFGAALAASVSRSTPTTGIASTTLPDGLAAAASGASQNSTVLQTSASVSAAGQSADVSAGPVSTGAIAKVATATAPATASASVIVPPANVPLVPTVSAPAINPTLPVVGIVSPPPATTSSSKECESSKKKDCSKTSQNTQGDSKAKTASVVTTAASSSLGSPTANAVAVTGSASFQTAGPQNLQLFEDPFHMLSATYTFMKGPGLLIEVSGGAMHDRDMSYLMGVQVERRVDRLWVAGGYQRFLSYYGTMPFQGSQPKGSIPLPNGVMASSVFSAWTGRVGGKLNRRTDLEISFSLAQSAANFVAHDIQSAIGRARINYWLNERLTLFADIESFHENGTNVDALLFSRQRYFGGLLVRISTPAGPAHKPQVQGN